MLHSTDRFVFVTREVLVFDPYSPEVREDPYPLYHRMRDTEPVAYNAELDSWFLFRFDDVLTAVQKLGGRGGNALQHMIFM